MVEAPELMRKNKKQRLSKMGIFKLFSFSLKGLPKIFLAALLFSVLGGAFGAAKLYLLKNLVDALPVSLHAREYSEPTLLFGFLVLTFTLDLVVAFVRENLEASCNLRQKQNLTDARHHKLIFGKSGGFDAEREVKMLTGAEETVTMLGRSIFLFFYYLPIFVCIVLLFRSLQLFIIIFGAASLASWWFLFSTARAVKAEVQKTTKDSTLKERNLALLTESGFIFEKAIYNLEKYLMSGFTRSYFRSQKQKIVMTFTENFRNAAVFICYSFALFVSLLISAKVYKGGITLGALFGLAFSAKLMWEFLERSASQVGSAFGTKIDLPADFFEVVPGASKDTDGSTVSIDLSELVGFEIRDLSVQLGGKRVLEEVSIKIRPGEKVAVVGERGSGKSTLLGAISGRYEQVFGEVSLSGIPTSLLGDRLSRFIGAVFEDPMVFPVSIKENITLDKKVSPDVDRKLQNASLKSGLEETLRIFPRGMETRLSSEILSKLREEDKKLLVKKIALARALYRDPAIVFIDDVPFGSDKEQLWLLKFLEKYEKTCVWFSENPYAGQPADKVVFLRDSRAVEEGSFDQLVQSGGEFAKFVFGFRG